MLLFRITVINLFLFIIIIFPRSFAIWYQFIIIKNISDFKLLFFFISILFLISFFIGLISDLHPKKKFFICFKSFLIYEIYPIIVLIFGTQLLPISYLFFGTIWIAIIILLCSLFGSTGSLAGGKIRIYLKNFSKEINKKG